MPWDTMITFPLTCSFTNCFMFWCNSWPLPHSCIPGMCMILSSSSDNDVGIWYVIAWVTFLLTKTHMLNNFEIIITGHVSAKTPIFFKQDYFPSKSDTCKYMLVLPHSWHSCHSTMSSSIPRKVPCIMPMLQTNGSLVFTIMWESFWFDLSFYLMNLFGQPDI